VLASVHDCSHVLSAIVVDAEGELYVYDSPLLDADWYVPVTACTTGDPLGFRALVARVWNVIVQVEPGDTDGTATATVVSLPPLPVVTVAPVQVLATVPVTSEVAVAGVASTLSRYAGPTGFALSVTVTVYVTTSPASIRAAPPFEIASVPDGTTRSTNCVMAEPRAWPELREHCVVTNWLLASPCTPAGATPVPVTRYVTVTRIVATAAPTF
jgi:hypothetical protein